LQVHLFQDVFICPWFFFGGSISGDFHVFQKTKRFTKIHFLPTIIFPPTKKTASHFCGGFNQVEKYEPTTVHLPENRVETLKNM